jgi:SH3-like domain-containing protein
MQAGEITASIDQAPQQLGPSGLPLPRFVTLKANKVNVRRGPSSDHPVAFVFQRKGLPVEIIAEFETWRKIRYSDGSEGWILQSMLTGRRNAFVAPREDGTLLNLHWDKDEASGISAKLSPGVLAEISACDGTWCELVAGDYEGFAPQSRVWGVYPGEVVD